MLSDKRAYAQSGCAVEDCPSPHYGKGHCRLHWDRLRKGYLDITQPLARTVFSRRIGLSGAHMRCKSLWGSATEYPCVECGLSAHHWAYDGTDATYIMVTEGFQKGQRYSCYPEFYMPMCRKCHARKDKSDAAAELYEYRLLKYGIDT